MYKMINKKIQTDQSVFLIEYAVWGKICIGIFLYAEQIGSFHLAHVNRYYSKVSLRWSEHETNVIYTKRFG